jgi:hypothetical protein
MTNCNGAVPRANIHLYQGDDYNAEVLVENSDGSPADLTGYTARAQIRIGVADTDEEVAAEFVTAIESPLVKLNLPRAIVTDLSGRYVWDLELTSPNDVVTTILKGDVVAEQEVTRA